MNYYYMFGLPLVVVALWLVGWIAAGRERASAHKLASRASTQPPLPRVQPEPIQSARPVTTGHVSVEDLDVLIANLGRSVSLMMESNATRTIPVVDLFDELLLKGHDLRLQGPGEADDVEAVPTELRGAQERALFEDAARQVYAGTAHPKA